MGIIYNRLKELDAVETQEVKKLSEAFFKKLGKEFLSAKLIVDIHKFVKAGARAKYSVHLRLEHPSTILTAEEADWDLAKALHKTVKNMQQEVQHKFKLGVTKKTGPKPFPV